MIRLKLGEKQSVRIFARYLWNHTDIELEEGGQYDFHAAGKWTDLIIITDADGYQRLYMSPFEKFRRIPDQNWFALIGTRDEWLNKAFLIGKKSTFKATFNGELVCFANDIEYFYWNNHGSVELTVTRIS